MQHIIRGFVWILVHCNVDFYCHEFWNLAHTSDSVLNRTQTYWTGILSESCVFGGLVCTHSWNVLEWPTFKVQLEDLTFVWQSYLWNREGRGGQLSNCYLEQEQTRFWWAYWPEKINIRLVANRRKIKLLKELTISLLQCT